ncbi:MAG: sel1 repeat family protein, partial [Muribaculaceae bacterium]|nr:sel1 repeat family protein [Muribaculaceae bacterium]
LVEIGNQYLFGLAGKEVNISLAHQYFVLAAKKGNNNAANILDTVYAPDKDELCDEMKVGFEELRKFRLAVEAGDPAACFLYGVGKLSDDAEDYVYHKGLARIKHAAEMRYVPAMYVYGCELLHGKRIPKDSESAMKFIKSSAEQGYTKSIGLLYRLGEEGLALKYANEFASKNEPDAIAVLAHIKLSKECYDEAVSLFERAATLGDKESMFNVALLFDNGEVCDKDPYKAAMWYQRAAELGDVQAMDNLAFLLEKGPKEMRNEKAAFDWYVKAAEGGLGKAWNDVATCYKRGIGVQQSFEKALEYYIKAANAETPEIAYYNLFLLYTDGVATERNLQESLNWLRKAADKGIADACWHLGMYYKLGLVGSQDLAQAFHWFNIAAEKNQSNAIYEIGLMYLHGMVVEQNYKKAFENFKKVSEVLPNAMVQLGKCYSNGFGCSKDYSQALVCYNSAALSDNAEAQYDLGVCYRFGEGTEINIPRAVEWYQKAIAQGHTNAMVNCAILFDNGIGVEIDYAYAYQLYKKAAELGNSQGQFCLGDMYFQGRYVKQDYAEAIKWFKLAAEQNEPDSIFHLAICYSQGLGVERNIRKAIELFYSAADKGWQPAVEIIQKNRLPRPNNIN